MLAGKDVYVGDSVYDIFLGTGIVESVRQDGGFIARFGSKKMVYQDGGFNAKTKRAFWRKPYDEEPLKEGALEDALMKEIRICVRNFLQGRGLI